MIERTQDADAYVYHYTSTDVAQKILESGNLRLGRYRNTNDPKESKDWHFSVGTNMNRNVEYKVAQGLSDWLCGELKESARLACFCLDRGPLSGDHLKDLFNRGYCKPRMWAQYAASHTGVCLIFRKDLLMNAQSERFGQSVPVMSGPVTYRDRSVVPNLFAPDEQQYTINMDVLEQVGKRRYLLMHVQTHHGRLFFEKMRDWENENEWRIVVIDKSAGEIEFSFRQALVGIMFGDSTDGETARRLMEVSAQYSPWFMALKWQNCTPWYDYTNKLFSRQLHG